MKKSAKTRQHIIEKTAPIFNQQGYIGSSLTDLCQASGLSKGAIYGHFQNKEELALAAFNYNLRQLSQAIMKRVDAEDRPSDKLAAILQFYQDYHHFAIPFGGCPILNLGIDAQGQHPQFLARVVEVIKKLENHIRRLILAAMQAGEFRPNLDEQKISRQIFSLLEGAIFMTLSLNNSQYLLDATDLAQEILRDCQQSPAPLQ